MFYTLRYYSVFNYKFIEFAGSAILAQLHLLHNDTNQWTTKERFPPSTVIVYNFDIFSNLLKIVG